MRSLARDDVVSSDRRADIAKRIVVATEELLAEGAPYAGLTIERIAERAGISRTAFYLHFRDKRELLMRLADEIFELLHLEAEAWWQADSGDVSAAEQLERSLTSVVAIYRDHSATMRAAVEAASYDAVIGEFWTSMLRRFLEPTREYIAAEQVAGRVPAELPTAGTAFALVWMVERSCYEWLLQDDVDAQELIRGLVAVYTRTLYGSSSSGN